MQLYEIMLEKFGELDKKSLRAIILAMSACREGIEWFDDYRGDNVFYDCPLPWLSWFAKPFLIGADLSNAKLIDADFAGANLLEVNFSGADLTNADLTSANLVDADFGGANLYGAYMTDANLLGANLVGANLLDTDLSWANLSDANLSGVDLQLTNLENAEFVDVICDNDTKWPENFDMSTLQ